jgi:hypothetical protein
LQARLRDARDASSDADLHGSRARALDARLVLRAQSVEQRQGVSGL